MTYCCQHFFAILEASTEKRGILMNWNETYGPGSQPDSEAISRYVGCPYWNELITYLGADLWCCRTDGIQPLLRQTGMECEIQKRQQGDLHPVPG